MLKKYKIIYYVKKERIIGADSIEEADVAADNIIIAMCLDDEYVDTPSARLYGIKEIEDEVPVQV